MTVEQVERSGSIVKVKVNGRLVTVEVLSESTGGRDAFVGKVGNRVYAVERASLVEHDVQAVLINRRHFSVRLERKDLRDRPRDVQPIDEGPFLVTAPMSGRITSVNKQAGANVESSESVLVLEAMKMENDVASPRKGVVREVYIRPGALVKAGDKLLLID
ncbi:MAG TPA: biotin/lipoyl-containing protein [Candidatus Bathyarchaeia archaeon]|nr:biotin/lipoyl-containing protein [Candidatus Bathyarchaeia archaeon]